MPASKSVPAEGGRYFRTQGDTLSRTPPKAAEKPASKPEEKGK